MKTSQAYLLIYRRQGHDENNNYLRLLNNIYFKRIDEFVIGEPIKSDYGKGYLAKKIEENQDQFLTVKYKFGHITSKYNVFNILV